MSGTEIFDVVVVGSGAAGAMAAMRSAQQGLSVLIVEKAHKFGGTSATSGGVLWVPNHRLDGDKGDSREEALKYLDAVCRDVKQRDRLEAYVDESPKMVHYLRDSGVQVMAGVWPDYYPEEPGARSDRSIVCPTFDGTELGADRWGYIGSY